MGSAQEVIIAEKAIESTALLSGVLTSIKTIEDTQEKIQKAMETIQWIKNMKSLVQLITILDNMVCTNKDLVLLLSATGGIDGCFVNFQYNLPTQQISMASEILDIVLTIGVIGQTHDRINSLEAAVTHLKAAQNELMLLKTRLLRSLQAYNVTKSFLGTHMLARQESRKIRL